MNRSYYYRNRTGMRCPCAEGQTVTAPSCAIAQDDVCDGVPLAMAYVRMQEFDNLYTPEEGFSAGTVFCELDKPFLRGGCVNG